jgi:hypothetical protein
MMMEWAIVFFVALFVVGVVTAFPGPRLARPGEVDHLCANGEFMPGRMEDCSCRPEWEGL